jgi:aryl-alcohol dehydrogenase-like predicted oxidoreductase
MDYVIFGDNRISRMTLGAAQLGSNYGVANLTGKPTLGSSFEILDVAISQGITCIDTAPGYGNSEKIIGSFLTSKPFIPECTIVTKLPALNITPGATVAEIFDVVRMHITTSMHKLHTNKLPIYLLHRASDMDSFGDGVINSLMRLKQEGLIGTLGISAYTPEEVKRALEIDALEAIQIPVNIFDHRLINCGLLDKLVEKKRIVFARSVFLQGLLFLSESYLPLRLKMAMDPLYQLKELCSEHNRSIADVALAFVRDLPGVTSVVVGADVPGHVLENIALMRAPRLAPGLYNQIMTCFAELPEEIINPSLWNVRD